MFPSHDPHWWGDWRYVDVNQGEYEIGPFKGEKAEFDYYIWETSKRDLSRATINDFNLVTTVMKNQTRSSTAIISERYVIVGADNTGRGLGDWSPLGEPLNLDIKRTFIESSGAAYYTRATETIGVGSATSPVTTRNMLWSDPYWRKKPNYENFNVLGYRGRMLTPQREYRVKLAKGRTGNNAQNKYVYTVWNITEENAKAKADHNGDKGTRLGCHEV